MSRQWIPSTAVRRLHGGRHCFNKMPLWSRQGSQTVGMPVAVLEMDQSYCNARRHVWLVDRASQTVPLTELSPAKRGMLAFSPSTSHMRTTI